MLGIEFCTGIESVNAPLRSRKGQFFEGGIRVPCIIKWPGKIKPATVNHNLLTSLEIFPTLSAAADIQVPDSIQ